MEPPSLTWILLLNWCWCVAASNLCLVLLQGSMYQAIVDCVLGIQLRRNAPPELASSQTGAYCFVLRCDSHLYQTMGRFAACTAPLTATCARTLTDCLRCSCGAVREL